ncbi:hypothetical protein [Corallococcus sp. M7]
MSEDGREQRESKSNLPVKEYERESLRIVYGQIFTKPPATGMRELTGKLREICNAIGDPGGDAAALSRVNSLLAEINPGPVRDGTVKYELSEKQWGGLKTAFTDPAFAKLRVVVLGDGELPHAPGTREVVKVGPHELASIYFRLFAGRDRHLSHNYLHALKMAALRKQPRAIEAILGLLYNDYRLVGEEDGSIVSLEFDPELLGQMAVFLRDSRMSDLEPYEGGGVCIAPGMPEGGKCY